MIKARIILDRNRYYYSLRVSVGTLARHGISMPCVFLCEEQTQRPHLTCLWCRARRVYHNKMPEKIPVDIIWLTVHKNQKHKLLKDKVRKFLLTLVGWTLN